MRPNLILFLLLSFFLTHIAAGFSQTPVVSFLFDEIETPNVAVEEISGTNFTVTSRTGSAERTPGIEGAALRTDGYTSWVEGSINKPSSQKLSFSGWVILESYPSDEEVPHDQLIPSAFFSNYSGGAGIQLTINTFGQWGLRFGTDQGDLTLDAPDVFPVDAWTHVGFVVDLDAGAIELYQDGEQVSSQTVSSGRNLRWDDTADFYIGHNTQTKYFDQYPLNALNGAFDRFNFYDSALDGSFLVQEYTTYADPSEGLAKLSLNVPAKRFEGDLQRPVFHGLPPANWTNEPHGLVYYDGAYHMFYQRTPNGPFKYQMHWGHMVSKDLVHWSHMPDALWPTLEWSETSGYDMKGIWSGDVVVENDSAWAFYTCVNHSGLYNPGVALATSSDSDLENWNKIDPLIERSGVDDFRDPFLWKEGSTWHMIIGAANNGHGDLAYYTSTDMQNWTQQSSFFGVNVSNMSIGGAIWEMPVFAPISNTKHILVVNPIGGQVGKYGPDKYTRAVYWTGTWENNQFTPDFLTPKNLDLIHGHLSPTIEEDAQGNINAIGIVDERRSTAAQLSAGWCHLFSMTRQWFLMPDGETLGQKPHPDYANIRDTQTENIVGQLTVSGLQTLEGIGGKSLELEITVDPSNTVPRYGFDVRRSPGAEEYTRVYYDEPNQQIVVDKTNSSTASFNEENVLLRGDYDESVFGKPERFHVFIDHSILEVYVNGSAAFATRIYPVRSDSEGVALWSDGGSTVFTETKAWQVNGSIGASSVVLIQEPSGIEEGQETNDTIHISVQNNAWAATLDPSGWLIYDYPSGLTPFVERISDSEVIITFDGTADDYDEDMTNFSVQVPASEFQQPMLFSSDMVEVSGSVKFSAILEVPMDVDLAFIGIASDAGSLTGEELEAYNWVYANYSAAYYSLDTIMADKGILDETSSVDLVWWHYTTSDQLPSGSDIAFSQMADFRNSGGALFFSGLASLAAVEVKLENTLPDVQAFGSAFTAASQGIWTNTPDDVFFTGLQFETGDPNLAITIDDGTSIPERYATWSSGTELSGIIKSWETSAQDRISLIKYPSESGRGKAAVLSTPSFAWVGATSNPNHQSNLEALAAGIIDELLQQVVRVSGLEIAQSTLSFSNDFYWQLTANVLPENADDQGITYVSRSPEVVEVDENGLMHALSTGQAWVVGTTSDGEFADSCLVETQSLVNPLLYSFEAASLANWTQIEGTAFSDNMVNLLSQFDGQPENADGWYYLDNTTEAGISGTGTVSTRSFVLSGDGLITFSGGQTGTSENLYVALVDASTQEELTRLAVSGNAWTLHDMAASAHTGKECFLKLVDEDPDGGLWIDALSIPVTVGPESIVFENIPDYLPTGYPIQLEWSVVPEQAAEQSFTITSSDTNIISIDENGLATGEDTGIASVTVSLDGTEISASLSLEVKDFLQYNFETGDLTNWHLVEGNAFTDESVVSDSDWGWGGPFNHEGTYHLWGFQPNEDGATGVLQTDTFKLGGNGEISFLIGGGNDLSQLYVALIEAASGTILMRETGSDDEAYSAVSWDAGDYVGTDCYIKIVDNATGGWGHINVDDLKVPVYNADKTPIFEISHKKPLFLKVVPNPVSSGDAFKFIIDGESVKGKEEVVVKLFNLNGRVVSSQKTYVLPAILNIYEMNVPVDKGLYLIQAESSEFAGSVRVMVN